MLTGRKRRLASPQQNLMEDRWREQDWRISILQQSSCGGWAEDHSHQIQVGINLLASRAKQQFSLIFNFKLMFCDQFMIGCQIDGKQFEPVETNVILSSFSFQLTHSLEETPRRVRMHVKAGALSLPWNEGPCR